MGYYDKFLMHEDKRDKGMNSTTNEKGTDGKKNNSSAYNHDYYMKNKEKWGVRTEWSKDDHDFDESNYDEKNRLGDSDFYGIQNPDGTWTVLLEDNKFKLPKGISKEELTKYMEKIDRDAEALHRDKDPNAKDIQDLVQKGVDEIVKKHGGSGEKEFDVDAAAMDVIRGKYKNGQERKDALGADYEMVQKRVNELMKQQKSSSSSSKSAEKPKEEKNSSDAGESKGPSWRGKNKIKHSDVLYGMNDWRDYECLYHHGIKGQKWGVRRFQNEDGTLTAKGQKRYGEKVTMHQGKTNVFIGGGKYKTHAEYKTANNFAKGTYKQNKARIKEEYKEAKGEKGALREAIKKRNDNVAQYKYELDRNRMNAGKNEFKRETIKGAAKEGAKAAAKVGAGVLVGMLTANYMNNRLKREGAGNLTAAGIDQHYEYKIGKAQVAKTLGKAVAMGALLGATNSALRTEKSMQRIDQTNTADRLHNVKNSRRKRAEEDERRWKEGRV